MTVIAYSISGEKKISEFSKFSAQKIKKSFLTLVRTVTVTLNLIFRNKIQHNCNCPNQFQ